ncbi:furin-like protease 1 [Centruroides sculpturatus]|uniref:furin-like protease 1 n=1 Tax=Centruroides sculpturatus TaxID=218467 RepID=UPI000C6D40F8|nr:furin-like protease 1 [Centruroides sculpturatus]
MWYLNRGHGLDMNVQNAWKKGITGQGIVVTILDDGLEKDHPDIKSNYDPLASYDVNNNDDNPEPRYDFLNSNRHGTRCAGEVAATANNSICAVGIAFNAHVGGVKMLDGDVTDAVEARSLSLNPQHIDIYSASWGPDDDGKTVDGPGVLATKAFKDGIKKGRNGLGSIFVWASGNGGRDSDNCNCDGYTNSIWTLSISSATENGLVPWYSEACSSTLATTYSSGSAGEKQIVTTDLRHECTSSHTGTSASAPLAAGICALALEANKQLTWRDMQHIVVRTANPANLFAKDWAVNGVGRNVSHSFGYGMMDAAAMVSLAKKWTTVPPQKVCEVRAQLSSENLIQPKSSIVLKLKVSCEKVKYLEHVQANITLLRGIRGDIYIFLISPMGTRSRLLDKRPNDNFKTGFRHWPFMTVHNWGENPNGVWKLEIHNDGRSGPAVILKDWSLILYGTTTNPDKAHHSTTNQVGRSTSRHSGNSAALTTALPSNNDDNRDTTRGNRKNASRCTKLDSSNRCLDCKKEEFILHEQCVTVCPTGYTNITIDQDRALCVVCHYTCFSCFGPNDYQCLSCHGDSVLTDDQYCLPKVLSDRLSVIGKWYVAVTVVFVFLSIMIVSAFVYVFLYHSNLFCKKNEGYVGLEKTEPLQFSLHDSEEE